MDSSLVELEKEKLISTENEEIALEFLTVTVEHARNGNKFL
jgi:hypothetical protein